MLSAKTAHYLAISGELRRRMASTSEKADPNVTNDDTATILGFFEIEDPEAGDPRTGSTGSSKSAASKGT